MLLQRKSIFLFLQQYRHAVSFVAIMLAALLIIACTKARIDFSFEAFFPASGPNKDIFVEYKKSFTKEDSQFALFLEIDKNFENQDFDTLNQVAEIFENAELESVDWIGSVNVATNEVIDGEESLVIKQMIDEYKTDDIPSLLKRYRNDPLYSGVIWNERQQVHVVHGFISSENNNDVERRETERTISQSLQVLDTDTSKFVLTGLPVIRARALQLLEVDQIKFLGGGLIISFLILFLVFRNLGHALIGLASVIPGYLTGFALMALLDKPITVMTSIIPTVVLVVLLSDTIHILLRYYNFLRNGFSKACAIDKAFSELALPCFFTSLTTALGFFSLVFTQIDIMIDLGIFAALSIMSGYLFCMLLLPALLAFGSSASYPASSNILYTDHIIRIANRVSTRSPIRSVTVFMLIAAFTGLATLNLEANTKMFDDVRTNHPLKKDLKFVEDRGFGIFTLNIFLKKEGKTELHDVEVLRWIESLREYAAKNDAVVNTFALPDHLKQARQAIFGGADSEYRLPETTEEAAQLLLLMQLSSATHVEDFYNEFFEAGQVIISIRDEGSQTIVPLINELESFITDYPLPFGISAEVTGTVKLAQSVFETLVASLLASLLIAIVFIWIAMTALFKSVRFGLLALLPNLLPLLILGAIMHFIGYDLKPTTVLVFAVAFGIIVDDTIHMLASVQDGISKGYDIEKIIRRSLDKSGRAIIVSSLVFGAGFSLLLLSGFEVLYMVGLLTVTAVVSAIFCDLIFLPALMKLSFREKH